LFKSVLPPDSPVPCRCPIKLVLVLLWPCYFTVILLAGFLTAAADDIILPLDNSLGPPDTLNELEIPVTYAVLGLPGG
jgi:hypothetical protein